MVKLVPGHGIKYGLAVNPGHGISYGRVAGSSSTLPRKASVSCRKGRRKFIVCVAKEAHASCQKRQARGHHLCCRIGKHELSKRHTRGHRARAAEEASASHRA